MKYLLLIGVLCLSGCWASTATITKVDDGVKIKLSAPGKVKYKDDDISCEYDTKHKSILDDVVTYKTIEVLKED